MNPEQLATQLASDEEFLSLPEAEQDAIFQELVSKSGGQEAPSSDPVAVADDLIANQWQPPGSSFMGVTPQMADEAAAQTEQQIAQRGSTIPEFARQFIQTSQNPARLMSPMNNAMLGLQGIGAASEALETVPANVGLAMQRGTPGDIPKDVLAGLTGQRPAQLGDIARASGQPQLQQAAPVIGTLAMMAPGLKAPAAPLAAAESATGKLGRMGYEMTVGKIGRSVRDHFNQAQRFRNRMIPKINEGLINARDNMYTEYGDNVLKVAEKVRGKLSKQTGSPNLDPTEMISEIKDVLKLHDQFNPLVDQDGRIIKTRLSSLNDVEKQALSLINDLIGEENISIAYGPTIDMQTGATRKYVKQITPEAVIEKIKGLTGNIRDAVKDRSKTANNQERLTLALREVLLKQIEKFDDGDLRGIRTKFAENINKWNDANKVFQPFKEATTMDRGAAMLKMANKKAGEVRQGQFMNNVEAMSGVRYVEDAIRLSEREQQLKDATKALGIHNMAALAKTVAEETAGAAGKLTRTALPPEIQTLILRTLLPKSQESEQ